MGVLVLWGKFLPSAGGLNPLPGGPQNFFVTPPVGDKVSTATLYDNPTSRDFVSLLPLTLTLRDYASTEKISDLPRKLSAQDAPPGSDPSIGDLSYCAPWGNLALFYRDFEYSRGLIKIAKIDSGMKTFNVSNSVKVEIELIKQG